MQMDRALCDVMKDLRHGHFAHPDVCARSTVWLVVDDPCGLEHEQPQLFELNRRIGNQSLNELMLTQQPPLCSAGHSALEHHLQGAAALANDAHRVMYPSPAETSLGDLEALPRPTKHRIERHAHAVIAYMRMDAVLLGLIHPRDIALDGDPRR